VSAGPNAEGAARALPAWAQELVELYESNAASQFLIAGNVFDRMLVSSATAPRLGSLRDFLLDVMMPRFDVVLSYDLGNGIRIEKGSSVFATWPQYKDGQALPKTPRAAIETLTHYFRYCANLVRLNQKALQVGCIIHGADLLVPATQGAPDYDTGALITLIRDWANDSLLAGHALATFLITENINDLHPLIANNPRCARIKIPLPPPAELEMACRLLAPQYPAALGAVAEEAANTAQQLSGATLGAVESLFKAREYARQKLTAGDLSKLKKQIVEQDCAGLIEFVETKRTLENLYGLDEAKTWLRQDVALWLKNDVAALPKGYLICGPVGTGKTYLAECLAGEAQAPVVKMKNFRDKWVGSTEGNLEKIFRLLHALGRCYVFVDEADQALGRRTGSSGDSGVSGRVYSMLAEEMGSSENRGKIIWILASSRPDLIEVDLKRPGRVDVKIPLFPTATAQESFDLIRALCRARGLEISKEQFDKLQSLVPLLMTPGAAEALAMKVYRLVRTSSTTALDALRTCLTDYQHPVAPDVMQFQIQLAVQEASDIKFVPQAFLPLRQAH